MFITGEIFSTLTAADQDSNTNVLAPLVGMSYAGGAESRFMFRIWMPFYLAGAVGGYQFDLAAGGAALQCTSSVFRTTGAAPDSVVSFANPFNTTGTPPAGDYYMVIEGIGQGSLTMQFAQAVLDAANPITVYAGASLSIVKLP